MRRVHRQPAGAHEAVGEHRQRAAAVREDPLDVGEARGGAGEQQPRDRARGVGAVFDHRLVDAGDEAAAAERRLGMGEHQRLAAVQLLHHRLEGGIAQPFVAIAGEQDDAVGLERVEAVLDLAQAAFDVGQRQRREHAEAAGMIGGELGRIVVALARDAAALRVVADPDAGRGDRGDRRWRRRPRPCRRASSPASSRWSAAAAARASPRCISAARRGDGCRCGAAWWRWRSTSRLRAPAVGTLPARRRGEDAAAGRQRRWRARAARQRTALRRCNERRAADAAAERQPSGGLHWSFPR